MLDLSRVLAGPYCTQLFADLGATVWKVEAITGDDTRRWGPPFKGAESAYFLSANRGKKSLAVDLKHPQGRTLVQRLARRAEVVVENFKVGDLRRYGLDYETLAAAHPRLVYASITGFGQTGPRRLEAGYDAALQALGGLMSVTGTPDGPPLKVGVAVVDVLTGLHTEVGILAALLERARSGGGQHLDVALFDVAVASLVNQAQSFLLTGVAPARLGSEHPQIVPYGTFAVADGYLMLAVGNDAQFVRACYALELPELAHDARFETNAGRVQHRAEVVGRLAQHLRAQPGAVWLKRLQAANVPATPVNDLATTFAEPQFAARAMRQTLLHPALGNLEVVGSPLGHLSRTPATLRDPPPRLGEHTQEVLHDVLGLDEDEIAALELPLDATPTWEVRWRHSVAGFLVRDRYRLEGGRMLLQDTHAPDFAAGLGQIPGRGRLESDPQGGYWIRAINEPVTGNRYHLRVGSKRVDHRLLHAGASYSLSALAAGQRVTLAVVP